MAIEPPVADGFAQVRYLDSFLFAQIGDTAGHLQYPVKCPGGQPQPGHGLFHQAAPAVIQGAGLLKLPAAQGVVGLAGSRQLDLPGLGHPAADLFAGFGIRSGGADQFLRCQAGHFDMHVDAVQQRAGDAPPVAGDLLRRAAAAGVGVAQVAAGTSLRCLLAIVPKPAGIPCIPGSYEPWEIISGLSV